MSVQETVEINARLNRLEEFPSEVHKLRGLVLELKTELDNLTAELDRVKELVKTFAVDAPEKVDPIRIPPKPKTLKKMFPDPPGDAAA